MSAWQIQDTCNTACWGTQQIWSSRLHIFSYYEQQKILSGVSTLQISQVAVIIWMIFTVNKVQNFFKQNASRQAVESRHPPPRQNILSKPYFLQDPKVKPTGRNLGKSLFISLLCLFFLTRKVEEKGKESEYLMLRKMARIEHLLQRNLFL